MRQNTNKMVQPRQKSIVIQLKDNTDDQNILRHNSTDQLIPGHEKKLSVIESSNKLYQKETSDLDNNIIIQKSNPENAMKRKLNIMRQSVANLRKSIIFTNIIQKQTQQNQEFRRDSNQNNPEFRRKSTHTNWELYDEIIDPSKKERKLFKTKINRIERFKNIIIVYPPYIIPLKSLFKQIWDLFIMIILLWSILYLPWELAYPEDTIPYHNIFILIVFIFDLIISFRTTFYNDEQDEIVGNKEIFYNYIRSPFFIMDVLSTIPFDLFDSQDQGKSSTSSIQFLKFLKLIRLLRLTRILSKIKSESLEIIGTLMKYFFVLMIVLHWMTLIWWTIVNQSPNQDISLLSENNTWLPIIYHVLKDSSSLNADTIAQDITIVSGISKPIKYIYTLYSMIMLVLGGEVTPVSTSQGFAATIFAFLGQLTIAVIFANMSTALFQIRQRHQLGEDVKEQYGYIIHQLQLPQDLKDNIEEYLNFCLYKKVIFQTDLYDFSMLNKILQQKISLVVNSQIISDTPLFSQLNDYEISLIMSRLSTRVLMPNEIVFQVGDIISEMYFIGQGVVQMTKNQQDYILTDGEHFGEYSVMQFWRCDYKVQSITFTIVHVLSKKVLDSIIAELPSIEYCLNQGQKLYKQEEKESFYNIAKNLDIFQDLSEQEINTLYVNYIENIQIDPNQIILVPDEVIHALYIILDGTVHIYEENSFLNRVIISSSNGSSNRDQDIFYNSIDDLIYQKITQYQKQGQLQEIEDRVHLVGELIVGQYFGMVDHNMKRHLKNASSILMSSQYSVKLGVINQNILTILFEEDKQLYTKLMDNLQKINRIFPSIQKIKLFSPRTEELQQQINYKIDDNKTTDNQEEMDSQLIQLRDYLYHAYQEVKDIQRKMRVVKPPHQNLKICN